MGISVSNFLKGNNKWYYDYSYSNTQKELINDDFFNRIDFVEKSVMGELSKNQHFLKCTSEEDSFIKSIMSVVQCPQSISVSISDQYKEAQVSYRYSANDFKYMCTNIYQDIIKLNISVKGIGGCSLGDVVVSTLMSNTFLYISDIIGGEYSEWISKMSGATKYSVIEQPNLQPGIINDAFGSLSWGCEINIIPTNFKRAMDGNIANNLSMEFTIDGRVAFGKLTLQERHIQPIDEGSIV